MSGLMKALDPLITKAAQLYRAQLAKDPQQDGYVGKDQESVVIEKHWRPTGFLVSLDSIFRVKQVKISIPHAALLGLFVLLSTGLRYEDLLSRDEPEVNEALELAHPDVVEGRYRRLKRASDLAFKQKSLQDYAPDMVLEPFKLEISDDVQKILQRDLEFDLLNNYKKG